MSPRAHPVPAVGAVVVHDGAVLMVRRARAPSRGVWAVPGGRIELGETLAEAAEREVREETGVRVRAGEPVWSFDSVVRDAGGRIAFHYVIVDLLADYVAGEPRARGRRPGGPLGTARGLLRHDGQPSDRRAPRTPRFLPSRGRPHPRLTPGPSAAPGGGPSPRPCPLGVPAVRAGSGPRPDP